MRYLMLYHMGHRQPAELPNIMFGMLGTFIIILVINWEKCSIGCHTCHRVLPWLGAGGKVHGERLTVDKYFYLPKL